MYAKFTIPGLDEWSTKGNPSSVWQWFVAMFTHQMNRFPFDLEIVSSLPHVPGEPYRARVTPANSYDFAVKEY